jgi:hypothetical protein
MPINPANPQDRSANSEDPMRELVALAERVELRSPGRAGTIVAGFRRDRRLSVYFGDDPYYQFDLDGRLRRAFVDGRLFRTQGNGLAALTRATTADATLLLRRDLNPRELEAFLRGMLEQVGSLREALAGGSLEVVRQVPEGSVITGRLVGSLDAIMTAAGELAPAINRIR